MGWEKEPQKVDAPVQPQTGQGVKTMPSDIDLDFAIAKAVRDGRILNDREKEYVYDRIDHYKRIANKYNISDETEKVITMFENNYPKIDSEELKKVLDYKNRDGSPIAKGKDKYSFGEELVMSSEVVRENIGGERFPTLQEAVDYAFSLFKAKKERHETGADVSETFNRLMNKVEDNGDVKDKPGKGLGR